jgi:putative membrane protein
MWGGGGKGASNRILAYYSYLFGFPSYRTLLVEQVLVTLVGGSLSFSLSKGLSLLALLFALFAFILPSLFSDLLVSRLLRGNGLFTPRRCTALSLSACSLWILLFILFSMVARLIGADNLIPRAFMMGFALSLTLRFFVVSALTPGGLRALLFAAVQPLSCLAGAMIFLFIDDRSLLLGLTASLSLILGVWGVIRAVNGGRLGQKGIELLTIFRAFMLAWTEGISGPLEGYLEKVGERADLPIDYLAFHAGGRNKGALVVSYIHSGPFRNLGSSTLPFLIKEELGKKLGCEVLSLHGVSAHDRDLVSQSQNQRVVQALLDGASDTVEGRVASPVVRVIKGNATATCQLFGDQALIALTVSPKSFDDLPQGLEERIAGAGRTLGLKTLVVDLHNSIDEGDDMDEKDLSSLYDAALEAMELALKAPRSSFYIGFSRVIPPEFSLKDGMGPAGVGALAVKVGGQTCLYMVIDGNNLVSGLREVLLSALKDLGISQAEVATTDIHMVNALSVSPRGYYPIGEKIDWSSLVEHAKKAATLALEALEPASFSYRRVEIKDLLVIGEGGLTSLGDLLEGGFRLFKRAFLTILLPVVALSFFILLLF